MPRTIETEIYQFDELSDKAKEQARNWYREASSGDNGFADFVLEDAATIADLLGIKLNQHAVTLMNNSVRYEPVIYWSGFSSQGDGACFEGYWYYKPDCLAAVMAHAPQDEKLHAIARDLQGHGLGFAATIRHTGRYYHAYSMEIDIEPTEDEGEPAAKETANVLKEAFVDFADWIYRQLEQEYVYQNSDEQIDETIRANEYEFNANGTRA